VEFGTVREKSQKIRMPTKAQSIGSLIRCKCPRCQNGKVFSYPAIHLKFTQVNVTCPSCGVKFETEPGFFWGAMYFSYALVVGISIAAGIVLYSVYEAPPLFLSSAIIIGLVLITLPFILRYSRMLMLYIIAPYRKYDAKAMEQFKARSQSA
jgi:uncharacterized protein (DUF983 family)